MSGIRKQDGPVAVTGASGYIGSRIVEDLLQQGYEVHACVRDSSNEQKVNHLLELGKSSANCNVKLFEGDLFKKGSYDKAFINCSAVIHAGATVDLTEKHPKKFMMVASQKMSMWSNL